MKRVLLDTSVYGELVIEPEVVKIINYLIDKEGFILCGSKLIRLELRKTPKEKLLDNKKLRILMLSLYDSLIDEKRDYNITDIVEVVAQEYFIEYKKIGGGIPNKKIINDFKIVATASLHQLSLMVSHDNISMLSEKAISAYRRVNERNQLKTPEFSLYDKFKVNIKSYGRRI